MNQIRLCSPTVMWLVMLTFSAAAQKQKPQNPAKTGQTTVVKQTKPATAPAVIDPAEGEKKVKDMVAFLGFMLNTLGNSTTSARDKDVLIAESYSKIFRDAKVQVEDDLDEERSVITNKDVVAYLKDINFFFKEVKFEFNIDKVERGVNAANQKISFPGNPVDYFFLDQFFNRQYKSDIQFANVFTIFTGLAIFVACMGLFGLASFMTMQRTKEIGVRKVLGSSVTGIVVLLSKGFIQLVLVANLVAWPLAWWVMSSWLKSFPYRIEINPLLFAVAGIVVVIIAFLSVSIQTLKSARVNPAETLKYE